MFLLCSKAGGSGDFVNTKKHHEIYTRIFYSGILQQSITAGG